MPIYEYHCENCGKRFEIFASIKDKEKGLSEVCPKCKSKRVHQIFGKITVITSSKTDAHDLPPDLDKEPPPDLGSDAGEDLGDVGGESDEIE